jgi:hypothetical protein
MFLAARSGSASERNAGSDPHQSQELLRLKIEPWRAKDAHNGGVEVQNGAMEGLETNGRRFASI